MTTQTSTAGPALAQNGATEPTGPGEQGPDEQDTNDTAPTPRPTITETGPMLPEDLGPPPEVSYDMGGNATGPTGLDEGDISRGFAPLMSRFERCADATTDDDGNGPTGHVGVRLRIHQDGRPVAARVTGGSGGGQAFHDCVRRVVAAARFHAFNGPDVMASWGFDIGN